MIAAKAVAFKEALEPAFGAYQERVLESARALAEALQAAGYRIVSGGTDTHLCSADVLGKGVTGRTAETELEKAGITVNKNTIPFDTKSPMVASGIRLGTPALVTRGMGPEDMKVIAGFLDRVLVSVSGEGKEAAADEQVLAAVRRDVEALTRRFPLYAARQNAGPGSHP
jgi:glycine hydroxymethyltransferase